VKNRFQSLPFKCKPAALQRGGCVWAEGVARAHRQVGDARAAASGEGQEEEGRSQGGGLYKLNAVRDPFLAEVQSFELELLFRALHFTSLHFTSPT
jgi:hypothetical protein